MFGFYDPAYAYELAVIIQDGMRRMYQEQEDVYYYITVMNENYLQPAMPAGVEEGILRGIYPLRQGSGEGLRLQLLGSGAILREVEAAAELLVDYGVSADLWSVTSFNELRRDGIEVERWNRLHPEEEARVPYVTQALAASEGPIVAASDYIRAYGDQIRPYLNAPYTVLGTDGFGRSDQRCQLRKFFEVDRYQVTVAALYALAQQGKIEKGVVQKAIDDFRINPATPSPMTL